MIRFLAISITLLLLLAAPLYAGMEPFYKGEWGMSPKEIQKLYGYEPFDTYADRETNSVTNRYETTIDGHTVFVAYTFDQSFWGLKLRGAYFEFLFDNSRLNHLQLAQLQALTNKMAALVQSPAEPFEQERHATANSGFADQHFRSVWRNSTTVAEMSASYFAPKNETGFGTSAFHVIFYDAAAPLAAERYAQTMAEITSYRQIDSSNR